MQNAVLSVLPSLVILGSAAFVALFLTVNRSAPPGRAAQRIAAARALAIATLLQGVHFAEEASFDFHLRLGDQLGLPGMSFRFFVIFNVAWLLIWAVSIAGLRTGRPPAFFAAWFLAIAGIVNGVAHPLLALAAGKYFPGLVTSSFVALASLWLGHKLRAATERARDRAERIAS